jgi:hypothetical protein
MPRALELLVMTLCSTGAKASLILCCALFASSPVGAREVHSSAAPDTLAGANLPKDAIRQIMKNVEATAYDTPKNWEAELRVEQFRLGGAPALVVKGSDLLCGATANCQVWLFRKTDRGWRLLLDAEQPLIADSVMFGPKRTHGLEDLIVTTNWSTSNAKKYLYKYDGSLYRRADE